MGWSSDEEFFDYWEEQEMLFSPDFMHRLWGSHGLPYTFGTGDAFHGRNGGPGVNLTTYFYLVTRL